MGIRILWGLPYKPIRTQLEDLENIFPKHTLILEGLVDIERLLYKLKEYKCDDLIVGPPHTLLDFATILAHGAKPIYCDIALALSGKAGDAKIIKVNGLFYRYREFRRLYTLSVQTFSLPEAVK